LSAPCPPWRGILVGMVQTLRVEPGELARAAGEFETAAEGLFCAVSIVAATMCPEPGLFGVLPAAQAALAGYQEKSREAVDGLRAVARALGQDVGAGLRATAAGYLATEEANVLR
jgi:excreted virulence factor EspC (type VII ESX diderm)